LVTPLMTTPAELPQYWSLPARQRNEAPEGSLGQPVPTHSTASSVVVVALEHVVTVRLPPSGKPAGRLIWYACLGTVVSARPAHAAGAVMMAASVATSVADGT